MAYRPTFDCLWCGDAWTTRGTDDLEGWAQLCPSCLGRAAANPFLRGRLRAGIAARAAATASHGTIHPGSATTVGPPGLRAPGAARAARPERPTPHLEAFPDDWFLRRGAFEHGAIHDAAWTAELDMVTRWLDGLELGGRIVEPAAGVGYFSPLLAERGELFAFDADGEALDRARDRLLAHHLRAHLHAADPWALAASANGGGGVAAGVPNGGGAVAVGVSRPDGGPADAVVAAFLLGRVRGAGLDIATRSLRHRLRPGGRLAVVELRPDPAGGPPPGTAWTWHDPSLVEASLARAGFGDLALAPTGRFFLTVSAIAR